MANKKISQLTAASALTGTEELPIVQSGQTVKTTAQDIADLAGGGSYLKYVALLSHTGTEAPVATVFENTLGSAIVWSRGGEGYYSGANASFSDASKVFISFTANYSNEGAGNVKTASGEIYDDGSGNKLWFFTSDSSAVSGQDEWGTYISVEIRVYP